jgi:hypothetical protein
VAQTCFYYLPLQTKPHTGASLYLLKVQSARLPDLLADAIVPSRRHGADIVLYQMNGPLVQHKWAGVDIGNVSKQWK